MNTAAVHHLGPGYLAPRLVVDDHDEIVALIEPVELGVYAEGRVEGEGSLDLLLSADDAGDAGVFAGFGLSLKEDLHLLKGGLGFESPEGGTAEAIRPRRRVSDAGAVGHEPGGCLVQRVRPQG